MYCGNLQFSFHLWLVLLTARQLYIFLIGVFIDIALVNLWYFTHLNWPYPHWSETQSCTHDSCLPWRHSSQMCWSFRFSVCSSKHYSISIRWMFCISCLAFPFEPSLWWWLSVKLLLALSTTFTHSTVAQTLKATTLMKVTSWRLYEVVEGVRMRYSGTWLVMEDFGVKAEINKG